MGKSIFDGRVQIKYSYGCYGMTRGGGKTWHGGMDIVGVDSDIILMPYYEMPDGTQKPIKGRVTRARIVTDHSDRTWEWGYYVCVQLDADQTPDAVNFMYFCHCSRLLVDVGDRVISGQQLAIMGETGNAEARTRTVILKYEPRPAARDLTYGLCSHPQQGRHLWRCSGSGQASRNPCQQRKSCHFSFAEHHCWPCQQWRCRRSCCGLQGTRHDGRQLH